MSCVAQHLEFINELAGPRQGRNNAIQKNFALWFQGKTVSVEKDRIGKRNEYIAVALVLM